MLIIASLLLSLGIAVIYSSSPNLALQQTLFSLTGIGGYFLLKNFDYRLLQPFIKPLFISTVLLLVIVFILGIEARGSVRWIPLGFFNFQPSELSKLTLILLLAQFWSNKLPTWRNILISLIYLLIPGVLIFHQPDLGTALTLGFIYFLLLVSSNISKIKLLLIFLANTLAAPLGWQFLKDYQKDRIFSFISPSHDPLGRGYNVIQSTIAVGSGQFFGRGLGRGTQSRLQFLPEFRTDFIFAFIAEELGFIGSLLVLALYASLLLMVLKTLKNTEDRFGELIIIGVLGMMFFQILINIGMNIGLMPVTGITLPLLSYGGSSIITTLLALGLVSSVKRFGRKNNLGFGI